MKTLFSKKLKASKVTNSGQISSEDIRTIRVAAAMAHLDATRDQFAANVARAKSRLHISEAGVLAGPVASQR